MSEHTPGIHAIGFDEYLKSSAVSESDLSFMHDHSPRHLHYKRQQEGTDEPPAKRFGTLCHRALFEPDLLPGAYHVRPDGMVFTTKEGKAWRDDHKDRPILYSEEADALAGIVREIHAHPTASRMLKNATFEQSLFAEDNGIMRKCRPDVLPSGGTVLPDLKTCVSAHPDDFEKTIADYGYYRKAAYYLDMCKMMDRPFKDFAFIAAEKTPPYCVAVYILDRSAVEFGRRLYRADLETYRQCVETNTWPGYSDKPTCIGLPYWLQKQADALG